MGLDIAHRIDEAMRIAKELSEATPRDSTLLLIIEQLAYLTETYARDQSFSSIPARKFTLGLLAAREYDTLYPDFVDILYKISWALDHQG